MNTKLNNYNKKSFQNLSSPKQDYSDKEFTDCIFKKCDFSDCKFSRSTFIDCKLIDCNLSNIKVNDCGFQNVFFENCKLTGVLFSEINTLLVNLMFTKCKIQLCNFSYLNLKNNIFLKCVIHETDFIKCDLTGVDFSETDLKGSKFQHSNLEKANFIGAINYYIDPTQNQLKKAKFSQPSVLALLAGFEIDIQ